VYGDADGPLDWFTAGEATSAVLLTATSLGLSSAPISDVIEVQHPRDLVAGLLPAGTHPYLVVRCGWSAQSEKLARTPRREPVETIRRGGTYEPLECRRCDDRRRGVGGSGHAIQTDRGPIPIESG
jgi:hypothetical protein